jgi:hypothetical protein
LFTGRFLAEKLGPTAKRDWWIYFGTIPPHKIELRTTPTTMLPGIEDNLAEAIECADADRIARLTWLRDEMKSLPCDQLVSWRKAA